MPISRHSMKREEEEKAGGFHGGGFLRGVALMDFKGAFPPAGMLPSSACQSAART
jgi:hypothetical protein